MDARQARQATGAGKRAKLTEAEQALKDHKVAMAKAIGEGKARGERDMPEVYERIQKACDAGEEKTAYEASGYRHRDDRYWDGGPDAARAGAVGNFVASELKKKGYEAQVRVHYDDTWDPDCGDMSYYTVYVDISWEKQ